MNNFAIFIITYERADFQLTLNLLRKSGCNSQIFLVIDTSDTQINTYQQYVNNNTSILIFDKRKIYKHCDSFQQKFDTPPKVALLSRIACEQFAKEMKLKSFLVMDDDIKTLSARIPTVEGKLSEIPINNFDKICEEINHYLLSNNIAVISFGNETSYFGGIKCFDSDMQRRCFNVFFRNCAIDFNWISATNEDYISSMYNGLFGKKLFEIKIIKIVAEVANKKNYNGNQKGGASSYYKNTSDYERSFYAVMFNPSASLVHQNNKNKLIIKTLWNYTVPKIISNKYKK